MLVQNSLVYAGRSGPTYGNITMVASEAWIGHARQDNNEDDRCLSASWISTRSPRKFEQNVPLLRWDTIDTNEYNSITNVGPSRDTWI